MKRRADNAEGEPAKRKLFKDFFIPFDGALFDDIKTGS